MSIEAGKVDLTDLEREWIAHTIADVFMPYGMDPKPADAARLLEARLSVLLAARGERGYHEGWAARAGNASWSDCTCGHSYEDHDTDGCFPACGCADPGSAPTG